jgi:hypothetical protein
VLVDLKGFTGAPHAVLSMAGKLTKGREMLAGIIRDLREAFSQGISSPRSVMTLREAVYTASDNIYCQAEMDLGIIVCIRRKCVVRISQQSLTRSLGTK